jgi:hypothetical protein
MSKLPRIIIFHLLLICACAPLGHSQDISRLSFDDQTSIEIACSGANAEGPASYHHCLHAQLARLGTSTAPDISRLSFDDQTSIEIACSGAKAEGPASYHHCLDAQLARLGTSTAPDISRLSFDDQTSIEIACSGAKAEGPASYHHCLHAQLARLGESPHPTTPDKQGALHSSRLPPSTAPAASANQGSPVCSESGSCYGDISERTGLPKTSYVHGYFRKDGTYVRGYYRSK